MKQYTILQLSATMFVLSIIFMCLDAQSFSIFFATKVIAVVLAMGGVCLFRKAQSYGEINVAE